MRKVANTKTFPKVVVANTKMLVPKVELLLIKPDHVELRLLEAVCWTNVGELEVAG